MKKIALFPGSFDPMTIGHESIIRRALPLFDEIIVAVGVNLAKNYYFPAEKRIAWVEKVFAGDSNITVAKYEGLTVDFCKKVNAKYILRGLRTSADFEFERGIAQMNKAMDESIETVFILSSPAYSAINSTIIRDILRNGGSVSAFVPMAVDFS